MTIREGHFKSTQCEKRARFDSSLMDLTGLELWQKVASTSKKNLEALSDETLSSLLLGLCKIAACNKTLENSGKIIRKIHAIAHKRFSDLSLELITHIQSQEIDFDQNERRKITKYMDDLFCEGSDSYLDLIPLSQEPGLASLYEKISYGNAKKVLSYLERGVDPSRPHPDKWNLLDLACYHLDERAISALLEKGASIGKKCIHHLILNKKLSEGQKARLIQIFCMKNASVTERDSGGNLPLHVAVKENSASSVRILAPLSLDVSQYNHSFESPYLMAIKEKDAMLFCLIDAYPKLREYPEKDKMSPYELALKYGAIRIAALLRPKNLSPTPPCRPKFIDYPDSSSKESDRAERILSFPEENIYRGTIKRFFYDHAMDEPLSIASRAFRTARKSPLFYTLYAKRISHVWGIDTYFINPMNQTGITSFNFAEEYAHLFWKQILKDMLDLKLISSFSYDAFGSTYIPSCREDSVIFHTTLERQKEETPVAIVTGSDTHIAYALFYKDLAVYCDRALSESQGVNIYGVPDFSSFTLDVFKDLISFSSHEEYFDPSKLVEEMGLYPVALLPMGPQVRRNCTQASADALLYSLFALEEVISRGGALTEPESWRELETAKQKYKFASAFYRFQLLQELVVDVERFLQTQSKDEIMSNYYYQLLLGIKLKLEQNPEKLAILNLHRNLKNLSISAPELIQYIQYLMESLP